MKGKATSTTWTNCSHSGLSSVANEDYGRADAVVAELKKAILAAPDRDTREVVSIMADEVTALLLIARGRPADGLATLARAAGT